MDTAKTDLSSTALDVAEILGGVKGVGGSRVTARVDGISSAEVAKSISTI